MSAMDTTRPMGLNTSQMQSSGKTLELWRLYTVIAQKGEELYAAL